VSNIGYLWDGESVTYRVPAEPSRHRVAVWRELRKVCAVSLQAGTWAGPDGDVFDQGVRRAVAIVAPAEGKATMIAVDPKDPSVAGLEGALTAERADEWGEFVRQWNKFDAGIASEIRKGKFTLAELDKEEHNLDRLRRWSRELRIKDLFVAPSAAEARRRWKPPRCWRTSPSGFDARGRP
jgi:hypothetical protein